MVQRITLGKDDWHIFVYYEIDKHNNKKNHNIREMLSELDCPIDSIDDAMDILTNKLNTGMTYSNPNFKTSVVCISKTTSNEQFMNTVVHEAKHVQTTICEYYKIDEKSESAAYLIGYIVQRMYRVFKNIRYDRF